MKCPNCKHEQQADLAECQACQVNFEKWRIKEERRQLAGGAAVTVSAAASASAASVAATAEPSKDLKGAAAAGVVCACMTIVAIVLSTTGVINLGFDSWAFLDVAMVLGLSYGVYCKSRFCAVTLFVYYVGCKIAMLASTPHRNPGYMSFYFAYLFGKGALASFNE